mmetsp:Transcript_12226/g.29173  ORF Transcript_12226/g.29173 Transcript_12226/m.29173 type:complete len:247 (-) Transcript_12226:251-991(-)
MSSRMRCWLGLWPLVLLGAPPAYEVGQNEKRRLGDALQQDTECSSGKKCAFQFLQFAAAVDVQEGSSDAESDASDHQEWKSTFDWRDELSTPLGHNLLTEAYSGTDCKYHVCDQVEVGPSKCLGGRCICAQGWRGRDGKCIPVDQQTCAKKTGGGCRFWGCASSRGAVDCQAGECVCKTGFCAIGGRCQVVKDVGSRCNETLPCNTSLGDVSCEEDGYCACSVGSGFIDARCQHVSESTSQWHWWR